MPDVAAVAAAGAASRQVGLLAADVPACAAKTTAITAAAATDLRLQRRPADPTPLPPRAIHQSDRPPSLRIIF